MVDHNDSSSHQAARRPPRHPPLDTARPSLDKADADTGFPRGFTPDSALVSPSDDVDPLQRPRPVSYGDGERRRSKTGRPHKHRTSGAFLLADPVYHAPEQPRAQPRRLRHSVDNPKTRSQHGHDRPHPRAQGMQGTQTHSQGNSQGHSQGHTQAYTQGTQAHTQAHSGLSGHTAVGLGLDLDHPPSRTDRDRASTGTVVRDSLDGPLDLESAQIVNMALNLSESKRLASRRNASQPVPRLAPLPDSSTGGSLRQHLQQQRRISRTISPRPDRSPRVGSGRALAPLQTFEPDGAYRYHFSQSTLARAQKAKEYLELMAQYRRVLDLLPPLQPARARPPAASPPDTPNGSVHVFRVPTNDEPKIGRPYDPLQYVRNRKVRARERKAIDGDAQGFGDVVRVSEWVDDVSRWVATAATRSPGDGALPVFAAAHASTTQNSPPPASSRPAVPAKPRRPRVDWVIDPADMLADVYWLEQDGNKRLVEDRHWRRVFPQGPDLYQPASHDGLRTTPGSVKDVSDHAPAEPDPPARAESEHTLGSTRDRAQQKLRALKGSHHRQNSSANRDLRIHRGSPSDSSDTDSDRRRRARAGTLGGGSEAILAKQMDEMIAREQREAEAGGHPVYGNEALRIKFAALSPATPEQGTRASPPSRADSHRRIDSLSEAESRRKPRPSPPLVGRASLEVPAGPRRFSVEYDTSQPNSPDLRPARDGALVPAIGLDLSPSSTRPSSPTRNPLTKVRSIFRERSRDRVPEHPGRDSVGSSPVPESAPDAADGAPDRRPSRSPLRMAKGDASHRSHRGTGGAKLRDDAGGGLRSLFLRPRIDSVLRTSVSKVGDMIWRRDGPFEQSSGTSSDDSEPEPARGRSRGPHRSVSRHGHVHSTSASAHSAASHLDALPLFMPTVDQGAAGDRSALAPASRPLSRRSSRFDLLKPPRIDVQNASPSASPPPAEVRARPDDSDSDSRASSYVRDADARLNAVLFANPQPRPSPSRHWSIADADRPPARAAVSKREAARLRALLLSSGVHAMEMDRRARERKLLGLPSARPVAAGPAPPLAWPDVVALCPDPAVRQRLLVHPVARRDLYPLAARVLSSSIQASAQHFQAVSDRFANDTAPALERRVEALRAKVAGELTERTQMAADAADEAGHDLVSGQRLKVKRVVDVIEKMLRRRRRRFRWARRAGWLAVEWVLVGFMWYVWFVVMITRVLLGVGKGAVRAVRWLLWL
ncbi:hypothetical protein B0T24DRAFT_587026 [Lasiosphaeria ovina]|uniref:Uncharacterized protein n=1 Tax=Lasiosphaeria ovina TaxID=92902 RepID=A0AAE0NIQ2_9PEZI|nr:hypothetical protein B0T24DRAFT_587026 [Lasiosphaeria ovina]